MFLITDDFWEVRETKEKGKGIFAKKRISKGTVIGDYLGKVIKTEEYDLREDEKGLYLMYLTDEASIYPDFEKPGLHLFNHSCEPNCFMHFYKGHTLLFALRDIKAGEELTISYMLSPNEYCDPCPHVCRCESKSCTGTMHLSKEKYEEWQEFQEKAKKKAGVVRFTFGKNLPRLNSYPKRINRDYAVFSSSDSSDATSSVDSASAVSSAASISGSASAETSS